MKIKITIDVKNLTTDQHETLKTYSKSAMKHLAAIKERDETQPIKLIGFNLKRIEQSLEYIIGVVNDVEPND